MKLRKYVVWSCCKDESETFADVVEARDVAHARTQVKAKRQYATLDQYCEPMPLSLYIRGLGREAGMPVVLWAVRQLMAGWTEHERAIFANGVMRRSR
jgi:hypothetical protein